MDCASSLHAEPESPAARAQAALWRQVALLEELAETGVELAKALAAPVIAGETSAERPEPVAMAFSRVARAVRMTALLHGRLVREAETARRQADCPTADERAAAAEAERRRDPAYDHKARVEAIVTRVARAQFDDDDDEVGRIVGEAGERLDDEDIYGDVLTRPVGELVALICRDLGLEPDWEKLGQEAWAVAEGMSGAPNSPFARPPPLAGEQPC